MIEIVFVAVLAFVAGATIGGALVYERALDAAAQIVLKRSGL